MKNYNIPVLLASVAILAVTAAATMALLSLDSNQTHQIESNGIENVSGEIVQVSGDSNDDNDNKNGTTFRSIPIVGTEAHDEWIEWYRTAEYEDMNALTRDIAIMFHDFEVKFNPDHDGPDVSGKAVALLIQKDRLLTGDDYDPTDNELLVHDWYITEHDPPADIGKIEAALRGIVGSADNMHYADDLYDATNVGANHGYVPNSLHMQNVIYWHYESLFASCEHFWDDCDADEMRKSVAMDRELTDTEMEQLLLR